MKWNTFRFDHCDIMVSFLLNSCSGLVHTVQKDIDIFKKIQNVKKNYIQVYTSIKNNSIPQILNINNIRDIFYHYVSILYLMIFL